MVSPWLLLAIGIGGSGLVRKTRPATTPPGDTTRPIITITDPQDGSTIQPTGFPFTLGTKGTSSDTGGGVKLVQNALLDALGNTVYPYKNAGGIANWGSYFAITQPGQYTVRAKATDFAGNSQINDSNIIVNAVAPPPPVYTYIDGLTVPRAFNNQSQIIVRNPVINAGAVQVLSFTGCTDCEVDNGQINAAMGGTPQSACIFGSGVNNFRIKGGKYQDASRAILVTSQSNNVLVEDVECWNTSVEALRVNYSTNVRINRVNCHNSANNPLDIGFNTGTVVDGYTCTDGGANAKGVHYDSTKHARVLNGDVRRMVNSGHIVQGASYIEIGNGNVDTIAVGSDGLNNNGIDVIAKGTIQCDHIYIHDINFTNISGLPIYVSSGATEVWINNCTAAKPMPPKVTGRVHVNEGAPPWANQI